MLEYSGAAGAGSLGSSGDILFWLLVIVFLHWHMSILITDRFRSLGGHFFLGFCFLCRFSGSMLPARVVSSWEMLAGVGGQGKGRPGEPSVGSTGGMDRGRGCGWCSLAALFGESGEGPWTAYLFWKAWPVIEPGMSA